MYNGWLISDASRTALMAVFPPRFDEVIAHHITLKFGAGKLPSTADAKVVGYAVNELGIEALVVAINGTVERDDGKTFHVTWSLNRSAGFKPVSSNDLIAEYGYTDIEPIPISVVPFFNKNGDHTMESIAKQRCRDEGYTDPDFVGTKGYPNWHDFTDEAIARIRAFVAEQARFIKPEA